jgi:ABC-type siderophore export system fused ATPase/permease subunit
VGLAEHPTLTQGKLLLMQSSNNSVAAAAMAKASRLLQEASNRDNTEVGDQSSRTNQTLLKCIGVKCTMFKQLYWPSAPIHCIVIIIILKIYNI